jgi:NAD(P)-dependent dehydrogenase (short-subunit alcohol dehydrogenase family)
MPVQQQPPQQQDRQPGLETDMTPRPKSEDPSHQGTGKLLERVAIITGGDSGIGRAVAISFAREGADVVILYLDEHQDAKETTVLVEKEGRRCLAIASDVGTKQCCDECVEKTLHEFGRLDILVNNAAEQHPQVYLRFLPTNLNGHFERISFLFSI